MRVEEFYSNVTSFSVRRYDRYTRYRFSLAAKTQVGQGEWHTEESAHYTTEGGCPVLYGQRRITPYRAHVHERYSSIETCPRDPKKALLLIITNIPMLLHFHNEGGHCDVQVL